ncbi:zinc-binding alcohol dehydrogenase [Bacillus cereus VD133]|uniref:Zinc-type alcohol dehydrogenase-like protein n=1 Tax=Bacillus cereus VD133 TaxID=1053233 RepID=A0A9W5UZU0_BACCE|nr:zinc-binding alcohol dehydrogenase family protein [Bacillus cereus]EOO27173.1 zinc-binding alcohol dehydrogenase [Bacillus cereus VD133]
MKAVGLYKYLPIHDSESLIDLEIEKPEPKGKDLLVKVRAVSVNSIDTKVRCSKEKTDSSPTILGWDVAGVVEAVGEECKLFKPGDEVYYAGSINRSGANCEFHLVDERLVGMKPSSIDFASAAALPLTVLTAWEALFERLEANEHPLGQKTILIIGAAGGVGSIATQLAKLAGLTVIGTASRPETIKWVKDNGADFVINHFADVAIQIKEIDYKSVDYILCLNDPVEYWDEMCELITPQGRICSIVDASERINLSLLKSKSVTFSWEFMFTRSMYETEDMIEQHNILNIVSELIDEQSLFTTVKEILTPINAQNLRLAHSKLESGRAIGKIVLKDF